MDDFASVLLAARKRSGLTQAEVASSAGLTASYLSFLENRKKPPPSDEVCRRLAEVLGIPVDKILDVAHLERAPEALRKKVRNLTKSLRKEKRVRMRALQSLLSPFLFAGPPGFRESALDAIGISPVRRKRIREVLAAVGRDRQDVEREVSKIIEELPEKERALLLERLPAILSGSPIAAEETEEAGAPPPAPSEPGTAAGGEPPLLYGVPAADEPARGPYRLAVSEEVAALFDDLATGDEIVVDPDQAATDQDLVVVRATSGFGICRLVEDGAAFRIERGDHGGGTAPVRLDGPALEAWFQTVACGTVVELRRPLRRPRGRPKS